METQRLHLGRLIDHVHLIVADVPASRRFYDAVFAAIGRRVDHDGEGWFSCDELFVSDASLSTTGPSHVHLAFQAPDEETVRRFHAAALGAGGREHGAPGERPQYHPGYYGAFVLDPDGNNIEVVFHGAHERSARSVEVTFDA